MSGIRVSTGIGIAVGGVGGALAALLGAPVPSPSPPPVATSKVAVATASAAPSSTAAPPPSRAGELDQHQASASVPASPASASVPASPASASGAPAAASAVPAPPTVAAAPPSAAATPPLDVPSTLEALLKAELYCDQKKLYDECSRAAQALEQGTAGPADVTQAKRFRKIALTYLVAQCEVGDPHACFIMAAKYRAGTELPLSAVRAEALQKRGLELCRLRSAPECPVP